MISKAKTRGRTILKYFGRHLIYVPRHELTGFDLENDLRLVIEAPKPVIFDVGANVGQTVDLFRRIFPDGRIMAFEPDPDSFQELKRKFCHESIELFQVALSDIAGREELRRYERSMLNSMLNLNRSSESCFANIKSAGTVNVATHTLDEFISKLGVAEIDLLKVDTQGLDYKVLLGGQQAFDERRIKAVLIELNFDQIYERQAGAETIKQFLSSRGLDLIDYYEKMRRGRKLSWCTALFSKA